MDLHPDLMDVLGAFSSSSVEYLVVGGWAVAVHSEPRFTKDLDLLIGSAPDNLERAAASRADEIAANASREIHGSHGGVLKPARIARRTDPGMFPGELSMSTRSRITALYDAYLRKAPKQSRSRAVVEGILTAAADIITQTDDEDTLTVQQVAERAGIGIGSLYDYFGDRKSLMTALAARVTEDNLRAFEVVLARCETLDLEPSVALIVQHAFDTYTPNKRVPRAILRIASQTGLMPTLVDGQAQFARALAAMLRRRPDVRVTDIDASAHVITNAVMGVIHAELWSDAPAFSADALRETTTAMCVDHLRA